MPESLGAYYDRWKSADGLEDYKHGPLCHACGNEIDEDRFCVYCGNPYHRGCLHSELLLEAEQDIQTRLKDLEIWAEDWEE